MRKVLAILCALVLLACWTPALADVWADTYDLTPIEVTPRHRTENRITARSGPGQPYQDVGSYKTIKITYMDAYFIEHGTGGNWVYVDLTYRDGMYRRMVYFRVGDLNVDEDIPMISFSPVAAKTTEAITPLMGPSIAYDVLDDVTLRKGAKVNVLYQDGDYSFAEFSAGGKKTRGWLPTNLLEE